MDKLKKRQSSAKQKRHEQRDNEQAKSNLSTSQAVDAKSAQNLPVVTEGFSFNKAFFLLAIVRIVSAFVNPISDCDEVFNYWEPTHFLLYGYGFQTWEYSPVYALRSYLYVGIHAMIGKMAQLAGCSKIEVFVFVRIALALLCAFCEAYFCRAVARRFGSNISYYCLLFLAFGSGMFNAGAAFLPSSFSMCLLMVAFGSWITPVGSYYYENDPHGNRRVVSIKDKYAVCIYACATAAIIGWPFCIVAALPVALSALYENGIVRSFIVAIKALILLMVPTILVDYSFYGRILASPINLMLYNSVRSGGGSALYGTEPWTFYFKNLILNFNVAFLMALAVPVVLVLQGLISPEGFQFRKNLTTMLYLSPFYIWFAFMTAMPHKEERFIFVVYPVLCLSGAVCLEYALRFVDALFTKRPAVTTWPNTHQQQQGHLSVSKAISFLVLAVFIAVSISRILAIVHNYNAPFTIYSHLYQVELKNVTKTMPQKDIHVCVGKEWYRFPSSFFLPSEKVHLSFLRSDFKGLLPQPYASVHNATAIIPPNMNNENREEPALYVDPDLCDYVVDFGFEDQSEHKYHEDKQNWEEVISADFLHAQKSKNLLSRAFFLGPSLSKQMNEYRKYYLLRRKHHHDDD